MIIKEALANGRLTERSEGAHVYQLREEAAARQATVDAFAIAAAMSQPWADIVLAGAVSTNQLESNVKAVGLTGEPQDWPDLAEPPADYWAQRSSLAWQ